MTGNTAKTKICTSCGIEKPISEFYKHSGKYTRYECKSCSKKRRVAWKGKPRYKTKAEKLSELSDDKAVWFFFNNNRAAKRYPSRMLKPETTSKTSPIRLTKCSGCGIDMKSYGARLASIENGTGKQFCSNCRKKQIEKLNRETIHKDRIKAEQMADKFKDSLQDSDKLGTCDIIRSHHEAFASDPDRLTSEFMITLICGKEKVKRYNDLSGV